MADIHELQTSRRLCIQKILMLMSQTSVPQNIGHLYKRRCNLKPALTLTTIFYSV